VPVGLRDAEGFVTRVSYRGEWPEDARAAVERALDGLECLLPGWCRDLELHFRQCDSAEETACTSTAYNYREASIYVRPRWLVEPPERRREILTHELVHVLVAPLAILIDQLNDEFVCRDDAPKTHGFVGARINEAHEAVTCDVAAAITRALLSGRVL
jgi:hypothetical protein